MENKQELEEKIEYFISQGKIEFDSTRALEIQTKLNILMKAYHTLTGDYYNATQSCPNCEGG